jgi:hypothetical protein
MGTAVGGPLTPFRRAWLFMATVAGVTSLTAAFIGRARSSTVEPGVEPGAERIAELVAEAPA